MKAAVIGASQEAIHALKLAKAMKVETIALDGNPKAEGLQYADKSLVVDISDENKVIEALEGEQIQFVLTVPIGRYLTTIGAVNDHFGLPGISKKAAVLCTDKYAFHNKLREQGLRKCHCYLVNRENLIVPENVHYPAILKPRYGSGSRGIYFIHSAQELTETLVEVFQLDYTDKETRELAKKQLKTASGWDETVKNKQETNEAIRRYLCENKRHFDKIRELENRETSESMSAESWRDRMKAQLSGLKKATLSKEEKWKAAQEDYVLEDAVDGIEYGVDGAVEGCNFELILLRKKMITPPPARQAVGYLSVPPVEERALCDLVKEHMSRVTQALGLRECLLHADLMIYGKNIFVIEISARPSGHNLHNLFTPLATGIDPCKEFINYMAGNHHNFGPLGVQKMMIHYFDMENCFVYKVPKEEELVIPKGVQLKKWVCNIKTLDYLDKVTTGHSIMGRGFFILEGEREKELLAAAEVIKSQFEIS